jgi:hypothetical protein
MRVLEKRLRRLEVGLLPPPETAESRRLREIVLDIRRRRAARLGLPGPRDVPSPAFRPGISLGDMIRAARKRIPLKRMWANNDPAESSAAAGVMISA